MNQQAVAWQPSDSTGPSFCMIRLGMIAHRVRVLPMIRKFQRAIDRSANEAITSGQGLLQSERIILSWNHFGYLQYWRSVEEMLAWTHAQPHTDWWKLALERQRTKQDLSIYHESYVPGSRGFEAIYLNLAGQNPGAARFGNLVVPRGVMASARGRLDTMEFTSTHQNKPNA